MSDINEISIPCNGRLGQYYIFHLRARVDKTFNGNKLNIRANLEKISTNPDFDIQLTNKQTTIKFYLNNNVVYKESIDLDFKNLSQLSFMWENTFNNTYPLLINIKAELDVDDKSDYLTYTDIKSSFVLNPINESKLFIDLSSVVNNSSVNCVAYCNLKPDLLEYKVDSNPWTKLDKTYNFSFDKNGKNQYAQVRGKYNGEYSYSNTIKILGDF